MTIARAEPPQAGNHPERTCVGCKARAAKSSLLRLVVDGDGIVPDPQARQPGRGAYLHPSQACFELAQRRRAISRALRAPSSLSVAPLASYLSRSGQPGTTQLSATERDGSRVAGSKLDKTENLYGKQVEKR